MVNQTDLAHTRRRLWLAFVQWFGMFREVGPVGLYATPDAIGIVWRRVEKGTWRFRPRLADRLFIAAYKITGGKDG